VFLMATQGGGRVLVDWHETCSLLNEYSRVSGVFAQVRSTFLSC